MKIRFWGTRGSIPTAVPANVRQQQLRDILTRAVEAGLTSPDDIDSFMETGLPFGLSHGYGGESSCVEVMSDTDTRMVFDCGSGLRRLGAHVMATDGPGKPQTWNFFMSHIHWDHIMGFPFFPPAYIPGNKIRIHGCHDVALIEEAWRRQQSDPCFPVHLDMMGADISFHQLNAGDTIDVDGGRLTTFKQLHHGDSYGYRYEKGGKTVVYSTDSEHKLEDPEETETFVTAFKDADMVIFDAMYSLADAVSIKEDWGHSSNIVAVELCHMAGVKHLAMFHHEPTFDDMVIDAVLKETRRFEELNRDPDAAPMMVSAAWDGWVAEL